MSVGSQILEELARNDGLLAMKPCWVARDFLPPGRRLGLTEKEYDAASAAVSASGGSCPRRRRSTPSVSRTRGNPS